MLGGVTGVPNEVVNVPINVSSPMSLSNPTGFKIISYEIEINYNSTFLDTAGVNVVGTLSDKIGPGSIQKNIVSPGVYRIVATSGKDSIAFSPLNGILLYVGFKIKPTLTDTSVLSLGNILFNELSIQINKYSGYVFVGNQLPLINLSYPVTTYATQDQPFTMAVTATDPDSNYPITFSIVSGMDTTLTINSSPPSTGIINWTPDKYHVGYMSFTVRATDANYGYKDTTFTINVENVNDPPEFTSSSSISVLEGQSFTHTFAAFDIDGGLIKFSITSGSGKPDWMYFNDTTGVLSGKPDSTQVKPYSMTVVATDNLGLTATQNFSVNVNNIDNPHQIESFSPTNAKVGFEQSFTLIVFDPDKRYNPEYVSPPQQFNYSKSAPFPGGMRFSVDPTTGVWDSTNTGLTTNDVLQLKWTPLTGQSGTIQVGLNVIGQQTALLTVSGLFNILVASNNPPTIISDIGNITMGSSQAFTPIQVQASDPDGNPFSYSLTVTPSNPGITISNNGLINWTNVQSGTYNVSVNVSDLSQSTIVPSRNNVPLSTFTKSFTITVTTTVNQPPNFVSFPKDTVIITGKVYTDKISAVDYETPQNVRYSIVSPIPLPAGLAIDSIAGGITWSPVIGQENIYSLQIKVTDGELSVFHTYKITVIKENTSPTFTYVPRDTVIETSVLYKVKVTATDIETPGQVRYSIEAPFPFGISIDSVSGAITWTPQDWQVGSYPYPIKVSATDGQLKKFATFTLLVMQKNTPPTITFIPKEITTEVGKLFSVKITAKDVETPQQITFSLISPPSGMTITATDGTISWTPQTIGTYNIRVKVSDALSSSVDSSFVIKVIPVDTYPVVVKFPKDALIGVNSTFIDTVSGYDPEGKTIIYKLIKFPQNMQIDSIRGIITWQPSEQQVGLNEITVRLSDGILITDRIFRINVFQPANLPPIIVLPDKGKLDTTVAVGKLFQYRIVGRDPENKILKYKIKSVIPKSVNTVSIDSTNGLISWSVHWKDGNPTDITAEVNDGVNAVIVYLKVWLKNTTPTVGLPRNVRLDTTITAGRVFNYKITAQDPEGFPLQYFVDKVAPVPKNPVSIDPVNGFISWLSDTSDVSLISFNVKISDGVRDTSAFFSVKLIPPVNYPPVIMTPVSAKLDTVLLKGTLFTYQINAFDPEKILLRYYIKSVNPIPIEKVVVDPLTGLVKWQSRVEGVDSLRIGIGITDGVNDSTIVFRIRLQNQPPKIELPLAGKLDTTITAGDTFRYNIKASDPEKEILRYVLIGPPKPPIKPINIDPSTGVINWISTFADEKGMSFIVEVRDRINVVRVNFNISLRNLYPIVNLPKTGKLDTTIESGSTFVYYVIAEDPEKQKLTYQVSQYPPEPINKVAVNDTGIIRWSSKVGDPSPIAFDILISDGINKTPAKFLINLKVTGNSPPVITLPASGKYIDSIKAGTDFSYNIVASDPENKPLLYKVIQPIPPTINPVKIDTLTGIITWKSSIFDRGPVLFPVIVSDGENKVTIDFTIILKNDKPIITSLPKDTSIYVGDKYTAKVVGSDPEGASVKYFLVSPPLGIVIDSIRGDIVWYPGLGQVGEHTITVRVSDNVMYSEGKFKLTVLEKINRLPIITLSLLDTSIEANTLYTGRISGYDPEGLQVSYILYTYPQGMRIPNPLVGTITWTPTASQIGKHIIIAGISDNVTVARDTFEITVFINNPPNITKLPISKTIETGKLYQDQVLGEDPEGKAVKYKLKYAPQGMGIDSLTGLISWTPQPGQDSIYTITITVSDGIKETGGQYTLTVKKPNIEPPVITYLPKDTTIDAGTSYKTTVLAKDPEGEDVLFNLIQKPTSMSINEKDGVILWTPAIEQGGNHLVVLKVAENTVERKSVVDSFKITVNIPVNKPPIFTAIPDSDTVDVNVTYTSKVQGYDPEGKEVFYLLDESSPAGMAINYITGDIQWIPQFNQVGDKTIKVSITDKEKVTNGMFMLTVVAPNQAPYFVRLPLDENIPAEKLYTSKVTGIDPDSDNVSYSLVSVPSGTSIKDMSISSTGEIEWTPSVGQKGTHIITVRISDGEESFAGIFKLTVYEVFNAKPVINEVEFPKDGNIGVGQTFTVVIKAIDPEGEQLSFSLATPPPNMTINELTGVINWKPGGDQINNTYTINVNVSDKVHTVSKSFSLTVVQEENKPPEIVQIPLDATVKVGIAYQDSVKAFDPENRSVTYTLENYPDGMIITSGGVINWIPTLSQIGKYDDIVIVVSDNINRVEVSFSLTVTTPAPKIISIYPASGFTTEDVVITVYGEFFQEGAVVEIDPKTLENVMLNPDGSLSGILRAPMPAGEHEVKVTNPDGQFGILIKNTTPPISGKQVANSKSFRIFEPVIDTTPPNFTKGSPYSLKSSLNSVIIEIYNDEETTGSLNYGTLVSNLDRIISITDFSTFHSVNIVNLTSTTKYYYKVSVTDKNNNPSISKIDSFTTESIADTEPPIITLQKPITKLNDATIKFLTSENSEAFALYRVYGSGKTFNESSKSNSKKEHNILIDGLSKATIYEYRIKAVDQAGNPAEASVDEFGNILTFTTETEKDTEPPIIESIRIEAVTDISVKILWFTKEPSTSTVEYGTTTTYGNSKSVDFPPNPLVKNHVVDLTNLENNTEYHFRVISKDGSGNVSPPSDDFVFKTQKVKDTTPPQFTENPSAQSTDVQIIINFQTNEFSDTWISYREKGIGEFKTESDKKMISPNTPHIITIANLTPDKEYEYVALTHDESGNETKMIGPDSPIRTKKIIDPDPPKLTPDGTPDVGGITQTGAIINWITNKSSSSRVDYGLDRTYGSAEFGDPGTIHIVAINHLSPGTLYHFRVSSKDDESGKVFIGIDRTFTTLTKADVTEPVVNVLPKIEKITESSASIGWETDERSTSFVEFWTEGSFIKQKQGTPDFVIKHYVTLTGLTPNTLYNYNIISSDNSPNKNTTIMKGLDSPFKTLFKKDVKPPNFKPGGFPGDKNGNTIISGLKKPTQSSEASTFVSSITIEWITDEPSDSRVDYGIDENYGDFVYDGKFITEHSISLDKLQPGTIYHYKVSSSDPDENTLNGPDKTFRTPDMPDVQPPIVIEFPHVSSKKKTTAVIEWATDEESSSFVEFWPAGEVENIKKIGSRDVTKKHVVLLTNLNPGTYYNYQIISTDVSPNENTVKMEGSDSPFQTPEEEDITPPNIISGPDPTIITSTNATIILKTDEMAISLLKYGKPDSGMIYEARTSIFNFEQKIDLIGLVPNTEYEYTVYLYDKASNEMKSKLVKRFKTLELEDNTPPILTEGPVADFTDVSASFYWKTDEPSDSWVYYKEVGSSEPFSKRGNPDMVVEHYVIVTDLQPGKEFWFVPSSTDFSFNTMAVYPRGFYGDSTLFKVSRSLKVNQPPGGTGSFKTKQKADTQAPIIVSGPVVSNITKSSATVKWVTNENSNSFVNYGLTNEYGLTKGTAFNITEHEVSLTNLDSGTSYNYKVLSTDLSNNGPSLSQNAVITTLKETDIIPPVITAGPEIVSITNKEATVRWLTDEPSDSYVEFGFDSTFGKLDTLFGSTLSKNSPKDVTEHTITLTNLLSDTTYNIRVSSTDISENGPTFSNIKKFKTSKSPDMTPPQIDSIQIVAVSDKSVTIKWKSNELADSFVKYDSTTSVAQKLALQKAGHYVAELLENAVGSPKDVFEHEVTITGLVPGTDYTFQAGCADKSDNEWISLMLLFKTTDLPDLIPPSAPKNFTTIPGSNEVMLTWNKNKENDIAGYNVYRLIENDFEEIFSQVTDTFFVDRGLDNDYTYYYRITAIDKQSPPNESDYSEEKLALPKVNLAPTAPVLFSPADGSVISILIPTLTIYNSTSTRDTLTYSFIVSTDSTFNTNIVAFQTGIKQGQTKTAFTPSSVLANKTKYYWRARAFDGYFYGGWMNYASFDINVITAVELISFEAFENDDKVLLKWETASEKNNAGFNILRSTVNDGEFVKINKELIQTNDKGIYKFIDEDVELGKVYYYILQSVDINGEIKSHKTISVTLKTPRDYALYQNYPNPFNPVTNIRFDLPKNDKVMLKIYNILGQEVKTLINDELPAGVHSVLWDGTNDFGIKVSSGIYIYQLKAGKFVKAKKMSFIK
jgi:hypothetical protein